jgi:hypothetical protein
MSSPPSNVEQLRHVDSVASLDMGPAIFTCRQSSGLSVGIGTHDALVAGLWFMVFRLTVLGFLIHSFFLRKILHHIILSGLKSSNCLGGY